MGGMRYAMLAAAALATRGCAPDLDPEGHGGAYLLVLGACVLAILLLAVLRGIGTGREEDGDPDGEDRDATP